MVNSAILRLALALDILSKVLVPVPFGFPV